jgi:hypothetical protein
MEHLMIYYSHLIGITSENYLKLLTSIQKINEGMFLVADNMMKLIYDYVENKKIKF